MSIDLMTDPGFRKAMNDLVAEISAALPIVMNDARDTLKKHIDEDVYSEGIYYPKVYKRRSDNSEMGVSLGAQVYTENTKIIPPAGGNVNGKLQITTRIYFNPSGGHKYKKWHTADYNDLIGRIEKKDPAYTWGQEKVPARPFWQKFVDEMVDGGEFEKSFVDAMRGAEPSITADGSIVEETFDRDY